MYYALQLKLADEQAEDIKKLLEKVTAHHEKEATQHEKTFKQKVTQAQVSKDEALLAAIADARMKLETRGRKVNVSNLVRALIEEGMRNITPERALKIIDENGSTRGRPRGS